MACCQLTVPGETTSHEEVPLTIEEIREAIISMCEMNKVSLGHNFELTQVSPHCYKYPGVPMNNYCSRHGNCREVQYTAYTIGRTVKLQ